MQTIAGSINVVRLTHTVRLLATAGGGGAMCDVQQVHELIVPVQLPYTSVEALRGGNALRKAEVVGRLRDAADLYWIDNVEALIVAMHNATCEA